MPWTQQHVTSRHACTLHSAAHSACRPQSKHRNNRRPYPLTRIQSYQSLHQIPLLCHLPPARPQAQAAGLHTGAHVSDRFSFPPSHALNLSCASIECSVACAAQSAAAAQALHATPPSLQFVSPDNVPPLPFQLLDVGLKSLKYPPKYPHHTLSGIKPLSVKAASNAHCRQCDITRTTATCSMLHRQRLGT